MTQELGQNLDDSTVAYRCAPRVVSPRLRTLLRMKIHLTFTSIFYIASLVVFGCSSPTTETTSSKELVAGITTKKDVLLSEADQYLQQAPVPLTSSRSERSAGGPNDFYSEGDYWWPDPENPDGPYIRRDGNTNPDNFVAHRIAMRDLSRWIATLVAAYKATGDEKYAAHALTHLKAFFIDPTTRMNPNLLYAQAIQGRHTGRGIGIIDTIHLIEVAQAIQILIDMGYLPTPDEEGLKAWFNDYATWMSTHKYGTDERDHGNNHSTWWAAQIAAFAKLAGREDLLELSRKRYKSLLAEQMDDKGGFTDELGRTKPYIYMLFNLEGYSTLAKIASTSGDDLWKYQSPKGSLRNAWNFMLPAIQDKSNWTYPPDIQNFDEVPIQTPGMLFAAKAYEDAEMLSTWKNLSPERKSKEVDRNFPLRQPSLW